jgi:hypothetical protein
MDAKLKLDMDQIGKKRSKAELGCCHNLRLLWHRSPPFWDAMRKVKLGPNQYKCQGCQGIFKLREVQVDHIEPVVEPEKGWCGLSEFARRLFVESSKLQVLCQDKCHLEKIEKGEQKTMSASIHSYPKILNLGHRYLENLLKEEVTIEEKVDGSQFSFRRVDETTVTYRSKGREIFLPTTDGLFKAATEYVGKHQGQAANRVDLSGRGVL